jgi:hypothetical protein
VKIWFCEPEERDDSYSERGESTPSWLARSTLPRAKAWRTFLNRNLAALPEECQENISEDLRLDTQHWSAFFELVVARTLQELGASIACEPENRADKTRIDFMARFSDHVVAVEATSPVFNQDMGQTARNHIPLIEIIEKSAPAGWAVAIGDLPDIGPTGSKKQFKSAVERVLNVPPPAEGEEERELSWELPEGEIRLTLLSKTAYGIREEAKLAHEAPLTTFDDSERVIRKAVERKRRQARNVEAPVLVALDAKGIVTRLEDFDMALFGRYVAHMDRHGNQYATSFRADGVFARGDGEPTIAGVLAFTEVGILRCSEPVLYIHPRFSGNLPEPLQQLEQRTLLANRNGIEGSEPRKRGFLEALEFLDPNV